MKRFTCTEELLKVKNPETESVVIMSDGDSLSLPDDFVDAMCEKGWGTADGVTTGERKPGASEIKLPNTKTANATLS